MAIVRYSVVLFLLVLGVLKTSYGFGTFGFDVHHRFSDPVKGILSVDELPEKGTRDYFATMAHRDRIIHRGRGLAASEEQELVFSEGNTTFRLSSLGFLHYANVSVGTPSLWFLVALDTGSDLFWVPCDCTSCIKTLSTTSGNRLELNIYSPNASSTSKSVPCNSSACEYQRECSGSSQQCPYQVQYLSNNTSSTGVLVEDVLHLRTEENRPKAAPITFGCGLVETGSFLDGAAPNGLFGLGMDKSSVPSILSKAGITANSFSMCFGHDGIGRINFGDQGSKNMDETPFSISHSHPTYNISVTKITVETNQSNVEFNAIFDSGTSFTYLNDPAYTRLTQNFDLNAQDTRLPSDSSIPFEYCYGISSDQTSIMVPNVSLTMKGGSLFPVYDPIIAFTDESGSRYCLAVVKSSDVNIIGQNFMTGYNIIFDREKLVLGWKQTNCYNIQDSTATPAEPPPPSNTVVPPATAAEPRNVTPVSTGTTTGTSGGPPLVSLRLSAWLSFIGCTLLILLCPF